MEVTLCPTAQGSPSLGQLSDINVNLLHSEGCPI